MTSPVNNDKSMTVNTDRLNSRSEQAEKNRNSPDASQTRDAAKTAPTQEPRPSVDVDRAAHLFDAETDTRRAGEGAINDAEQARSVLERIKSGIRDDPAGAIAAFGNADPARAAAVMQQSQP